MREGFQKNAVLVSVPTSGTTVFSDYMKVPSWKLPSSSTLGFYSLVDPQRPLLSCFEYTPWITRSRRVMGYQVGSIGTPMI